MRVRPARTAATSPWSGAARASNAIAAARQADVRSRSYTDTPRHGLQVLFPIERSFPLGMTSGAGFPRKTEDARPKFFSGEAGRAKDWKCRGRCRKPQKHRLSVYGRYPKVRVKWPV